MRISDWSSDVCSSDLASWAIASSSSSTASRVDAFMLIPRRMPLVAERSRLRILGVELGIGHPPSKLSAGTAGKPLIHGSSIGQDLFDPKYYSGETFFLVTEGTVFSEQIGRASCRERVCQYV